MFEDEKQCRRIVVDHRCGLCAAENREAVFEIRRAAAAGACDEPVFEGAVVGADHRQRADAVRSKWRPPEIGVDEYSRSVDHRRQARRTQSLQARTDASETAAAGGIAFFDRSAFRYRRTVSTTTGPGSPVSPSDRRILSTDGIARRREDFIQVGGEGGNRSRRTRTPQRFRPDRNRQKPLDSLEN